MILRRKQIKMVIGTNNDIYKVTNILYQRDCIKILHEILIQSLLTYYLLFKSSFSNLLPIISPRGTSRILRGEELPLA